MAARDVPSALSKLKANVGTAAQQAWRGFTAADAGRRYGRAFNKPTTFQPGDGYDSLPDLRRGQYQFRGGDNVQTYYTGARGAFVPGTGAALSGGYYVTTKRNPDMSTSVIDRGKYLTLQGAAGMDVGGGLEMGVKPGRMSEGKSQPVWAVNAGPIGLQGDFRGGSNPSYAREPGAAERFRARFKLGGELGATFGDERTWAYPTK
jgi:hypothetical protein